MTVAHNIQPWRLIAAEIIAASKADPDSLSSIYEDKEFRPVRDASLWAQLSARLAQARKAYREAVAGGFLKDVQHNMIRRCFAHDYSSPGSYMITLAVPERGTNPFGYVCGDVRHGRKGMTISACEKDGFVGREAGPLRMELSPLGAAILEALKGISANYPMIEVRKAQIMPDHLHLILVVHAPIVSSNGTPRHLGHVIAGFKKGCNRAYWDVCGMSADGSAGADGSDGSAGEPQRTGAGGAERADGAERFSRSAMKKVPSDARTGRPSLWADGYTDTIILSSKHMLTEEAYLDDNIYRLRMKQLHRDLFRKVHHIRINGGDYAALGNIHLLRNANKEQVQFHRWEQDVPAKDSNGQPIQGVTEADAHTERLLKAGDMGSVLVSPFISKTEKAIRDAALTMGMSYIRLTREGFSSLYAPSRSEFDACCEGHILILAPWEDRQRTATITRNECMELNRLAQSIASDELDLILVNDNDNNDTK